jgi:predicted  nucleic acid-binding Zn-ribbon protein
MAAQNLSIQIAATDKTGAAFRSVKTSISDLNSSVSNVTGKIAGLTAVLATVGSAVQIKSLIDTADNMNKLSQKTGIAVSELSSLSNTADLAGVSNEQLGSALIRLNKSIAEAASGSKEQSEAFKNLGINVKDANGNIRPTADILGEVAGALSGAADGATKTQYAMALFGKAGADLIPFLNQGKEGIKEFGASFGDEFAQNAEKFNDNITKLNQSFKLILVDAINPALEGLNKLIIEFQAGTKHSGGFLDAIRNFGTINPFKTTEENLATVREQIETNNAAIERYKRANADTRALDDYNRHLQNRLNYLKAIQESEMKPMFHQSIGKGRRDIEPTKKPLPALGKVADKSEAEKELEKIATAYQSISTEIEKLFYTEDQMLLSQFQRITNDEKSIEQYKILLAERRKILNLDAELEQAGKTADKLQEEALKKQNDLLQTAKKLYEDTRTPLENFNIEMARLDDLLNKGYISWDVYSRATLNALEDLDTFKEKGKDTFEELKDAINGWGNEFTNVMTSAVMTGKLSFSDLANSIIRDLIRMQIQSMITTPLVAMGKSFLNIKPDGARAMGGPVTTGKSYLVGENGPEIFTPSGSGAITANNQIASGGVTVNQVINVSTGVQQTVRAEILTLMPQIAGAAKAAVADAKMRGGGYAAAMR